MSKLEKYSAYKESGVEWLGEIPEGWEVSKLKTFANFINRGSTPSYIEKSDVYIINQATFSKGYLDFKNIKYTDETIDSFYKNRGRVFKDDLLIASTGGGVLGKVLYFDLDNGNFIADSHVTIIRTNENSINKFYFYFFQNNYELINGILAQGSTNQTELQRSWLRDLLLPFPPKQEQIKIAQFLDIKTEQIDKAITQKVQLIELLKERRQIIINDAVTKGIDKSVAMKDSGVEWIGDVPEDWEVKKLKYIFNFSKGLTITKENLRDEGIECVNYGEIHSKYGFELNPKIHKLKCVNSNYIKSDKKSLLNFGDFIFADTSEDIEGSGNFTYLNSDIKTFAGYHTVIARSKIDINPRFFAYTFDSSTFRYQIQRMIKGVKVYSITQGLLKDIFIWIPPLSVQKELVETIDNKVSKIDKAIDLQQQQITKLKEYKTTLIDSVVTGKVRVS